MKQDTTYEKIERSLLKDKCETAVILSDNEERIRRRMMVCVSRKMDDPLIEDVRLVEFLMGGCGGEIDAVSQTQAYRDIAMVNRLVGNIKLAAKSWYRYMIVEGAKKAYALAIGKEDAKGAAAALDKLGKYTRADKDDDAFDYSQLLPPSFEPSDDVTLLEGIEEIPNIEDKRKEMRNMFKGMMQKTAVDIEPVK
jgi:hypothetical protein